MRYLLDTNIVSNLIRNPQGQVADRIRKVGEARVATSIIVAAELRFGAAKKGSARLTAKVEAVLGANGSPAAGRTGGSGIRGASGPA
jgi:tRNA(fMet)-specific endonuclease VapC